MKSVLFAAALRLFLAPVAQAADITVLAGRATQDILIEMQPFLEKATGLMVEKMGIADKVTPKMMQVSQGVRVAGLLAKREVEIGLQQASELINEPGIDYLGPLPPELQKTSPYAAGIGIASKQPDAARALIKALISPEAVAVMKKHGLEPG